MSKDSDPKPANAAKNAVGTQNAVPCDDAASAQDSAPAEASTSGVDATREMPATDGTRVAATAPDTRISPATFAEANEADAAANTMGTRRFRAKFAATCAVVVVLLAAFGGIGYAWGWFAPSASLIEAQANNESATSSENELARTKAESSLEKETEATKEDAAASIQQTNSDSDKSTTAATDNSVESAAVSSSGVTDESASSVGSTEIPSPSAGSTESPSPPPSPSPSESDTSFDPVPSDSSSTESSEQTNVVPEPTTITVSVYIDSSRAVSYGYASCMASTSVSLQPGASVYDALLATGVSVGGSSSYVRSIGGLAEFACGGGSGWLFFVNGSSPGYGCGSYQLYGGESIQWVYTLDMGNDL